jgi:hypothetical protein
MKKRLSLTAIGLGLATLAGAPSTAQAHCHCWHWHHWSHVHYHWVAPVIDYVTVWYDNPHYYWSPYTVVDHYATDAYPYTFVGDPILVHRVTEIGPTHVVPVPVGP